MDIACPNCAAAYRVPDALVFSRKPVRCAACGTRWVPDLPTEASFAPAEAPSTPPAPSPRGADSPAPAPAVAEARLEDDASTPQPAPEGAAPRNIGPDAHSAPPPEARPGPMSIGPTPVEVVAETGALTPRPAMPPPLVESRWTPGAKPRRHRGAALLPLAWAGSLLLAGGLFALLWLFQREVAAAWPPFERVVRLLGG